VAGLLVYAVALAALRGLVRGGAGPTVAPGLAAVDQTPPVGSNGSNGRHPPEPGDPPPLEQWVPGPGWQRRAVPMRPRRGSRRRLRLVLGGTGGFLLLVAWSLAFTNGVRSVEPTIDDEVFVGEAEDICEGVRDRLAEAAEARGDEDLSPVEQADAVDATVDVLDDMVSDLRDIQPSDADGEEVAAWLVEWERVLASGRRTADALRGDDRDAAEDADRDGQAPARAVNAFAGANGLPACGTTPA
jgi:hypothetical protein